MLFSFNPNIVKVVEPVEIFPLPCAPPDPIKCMMYSFLVAVLYGIAVWVLKRAKWHPASAGCKYAAEGYEAS